MLVSIVIPVFNRAEMVKPTLESVRKQTHRPLQVVLVDNNSSDNTLQVLHEFKASNETEGFRIDVVEENTPGACAARNAGAEVAVGEWIMFFDSDDTMDACLVAKYVEKIEKRQGNVDIVTTNVEMIKEGKSFSVNFAKKDFMVNHIFHSCLSTQRYIVRKSLFESAGRWNNDVKCWNDWELGMRLLLADPRIAVIEDGVYVHINVHEASITGNSYSENHERRENAISVAIDAVSKSDYLQKNRVLRLLRIRRFVLAGLYRKERNNSLAQEYYTKAYEGLNGDKLLCFLAPVVYRYVGCGGRGVDRLLRILI